MKSAAVLLEREKRATERERRIWAMIENPVIVRTALLAALLYGSRAIRDRETASPGMKAASVGLATIGVPMLAADAGITDKYALAIISAMSAALVGVPSGWMDSDDPGMFTIGGKTVSVKEWLASIASGGNSLIGIFNPSKEGA